MNEHSDPIQEQMVLEHLRGGPLTALEALQRYRIFRLAARVYQLRQHGHDIVTVMVKNNYGRKPYGEYHLLHTTLLVKGAS